MAVMAYALLLLAFLNVAQGSDTLDAAKTLSSSSAELAKDTASIADKVTATMSASKTASTAAAKAKEEAEAEKAAEVKKMTDEVTAITAKANQATADATATVAKLTGDAAAAVQEAQTSTEKAKIETKLAIAKEKAAEASVGAQEKLALSLKVEEAEKKASEAEAAANDMSVKSSKDVADTLKAGIDPAAVAAKVEAMKQKALEAMEAAEQEEMAQMAGKTEQLITELKNAQTAQRKAEQMLFMLQQDLTKAQKESMSIVDKEFSTLLQSTKKAMPVGPPPTIMPVIKPILEPPRIVKGRPYMVDGVGVVASVQQTSAQVSYLDLGADLLEQKLCQISSSC